MLFSKCSMFNHLHQAFIDFPKINSLNTVLFRNLHVNATLKLPQVNQFVVPALFQGKLGWQSCTKQFLPDPIRKTCPARFGAIQSCTAVVFAEARRCWYELGNFLSHKHPARTCRAKVLTDEFQMFYLEGKCAAASLGLEWLMSASAPHAGLRK